MSNGKNKLILAGLNLDRPDLGKRRLLISSRTLSIIANGKDVPVNMKAWKEKQNRLFNWSMQVIKNGIDGEMKSIIDDFIKLMNKVYAVDRESINQKTEYGYYWIEYNFSSLLKSLKDLIESTFYLISEGRVEKTLLFVNHLEAAWKKIDIYRQGFNEISAVSNNIFREYIESESDELTEVDYDEFRRKHAIIKRWMGSLSDIERAVHESTIETLNTVLEWSKKGGPDRSKIDKLYHTTVNASIINEQGFKPNAEQKGLGGATDGMISTTVSKGIALGIADALEKVIKIANGRINFETLLAWAKKGGVLDNILGSSTSYLPSLKQVMSDVKFDDAIRMVNKGYIPVFPYGLDMPEVDSLPPGSILIKERKVGEVRLAEAYWEKNQKKHDDLLFNTFRLYLSLMESAGKGYDPLFFFVSLDNFRGMDNKNVGIFELTADMSDERIKYVPGMYEFRVPVESIKSLKQIG
jgi:hypothetical protein